MWGLHVSYCANNTFVFQISLCPVCRKLVRHLAEHRTRLPGHGWSANKARHAANILGMRKATTLRGTGSSKKYDIRKQKQCPVVGCNSVVSRLDRHMLLHDTASKWSLFYGTSKQKTSEDLLTDFKGWLVSADGGCLATRTASRQAEQLDRMTKALNLTTCLDIFSDREKLSNYFTENTNTGWNCNTAISYNFSVASFAKFIQVSYFEHYFNENKKLWKWFAQPQSQCRTNMQGLFEMGSSHTTRKDGSPITSAEDVRQHLIISEDARTVRYGPMRT